MGLAHINHVVFAIVVTIYYYYCNYFILLIKNFLGGRGSVKGKARILSRFHT